MGKSDTARRTVSSRFALSDPGEAVFFDIDEDPAELFAETTAAPSAEQLDLMADILGGLFGDEALTLFDEPEKFWEEAQHPRGKAGKFIEKHSPEARQAAREAIGRILKGERTADTHKALVEHLSLLTVAQLHELKKEYGLSASAGLKEQLVAKLADRLGRGRHEQPERKLEPPKEMTKDEIGKRLDELLSQNGPKKTADDELKKADVAFEVSHNIHHAPTAEPWKEGDGYVVTQHDRSTGKLRNKIVSGPFPTEDEAVEKWNDLRDEHMKPFKEKVDSLKKEQQRLLDLEKKMEEEPEKKAVEPVEPKEVRGQFEDAIADARKTDKQFKGEGRYEAELWTKLRDKHPKEPLPKLSREGAEYARDLYESDGKPVPPEVLADYPDLAPKPAPAPEKLPAKSDSPIASERPPEKPTHAEFEKWLDKGWTWGEQGWEEPKTVKKEIKEDIPAEVHKAAAEQLTGKAKKTIAAAHDWEKTKPWNADKNNLPPGFKITKNPHGEVAHFFDGEVNLSPKFFDPNDVYAGNEESRRHIVYHELGHQLADTMVGDGTSFQLHDAGVIPEKHELGSGTIGGHGDEEALADAYAMLHTDPAWLRKHHPKMMKIVEERAKALGMPLPSGSKK